MRGAARFVGLSVMGMLVACAGPPPAPVVDRSVGNAAYTATPDGFYRVTRGDTLYAIAFRYGLDWRELARLNAIAPPYVIHPDQLLRLESGHGKDEKPDAGGGPEVGTEAASAVATTRPAPAAGGATTRPLKTPQARTVTQDPDTPGNAESPPPSYAGTTSTGGSQRPQPEPDAPQQTSLPVDFSGRDPSRWLWPAEGRVSSRFRSEDPARKGIDISGEVGHPVTASAPGLVVYSGSGLIGYGELIIIKHSDRMLSAYAHNSKRLVSEGQQVAAGAKIAEMGTNDRNQSVLHFEIRVNGTPQDPLKYLPTR